MALPSASNDVGDDQQPDPIRPIDPPGEQQQQQQRQQQQQQQNGPGGPPRPPMQSLQQPRMPMEAGQQQQQQNQQGGAGRQPRQSEQSFRQEVLTAQIMAWYPKQPRMAMEAGQLQQNQQGVPGGQPGPSIRSLERLLIALKAPISPQRDEQVTTMVASNPSLMATFGHLPYLPGGPPRPPMQSLQQPRMPMEAGQQQQQQNQQGGAGGQPRQSEESFWQEVLTAQVMAWYPRSASNDNQQSQPKQPRMAMEAGQQHQQQQQQQQQNPLGVPGVQPGPSIRSLKRLLIALKSPISPQRDEQVTTMVASNPSLMATFGHLRYETSRMILGEPEEHHRQQQPHQSYAMQPQQHRMPMPPQGGPGGLLRQSMQQFLTVLRSPDTPQREERLMTHLVKDPDLLAACRQHPYVESRIMQRQLQPEQLRPQAKFLMPRVPRMPRMPRMPESPLKQQGGTSKLPRPSMQTLKHLITVLQTSTPQSHQQVMSILKNHPILMEAFIKQQQLQQQHQAQQKQGGGKGQVQQGYVEHLQLLREIQQHQALQHQGGGQGQLQQGQVKQGQVKQGQVKQGQVQQGHEQQGHVQQGHVQQPGVGPQLLQLQLREARMNAIIERQKLLEIATELNCPVCFEDMNSSYRIFACSNDHLICARCLAKESIIECPQCREDFMRFRPKRQFKMEKIAEIVFRHLVEHSFY
jgi:hypothetical protein